MKLNYNNTGIYFHMKALHEGFNVISIKILIYIDVKLK